MKTIIIGIIVFLVGSIGIIAASKNSLLLQGSFRGAPSTVRREVPSPNLVGGGGISKDAGGTWKATGGGGDCQIYDVEITDPRTGQKRTVTFSTCPMKCCYTGQEMTKADDWAAKAGVNAEQKKAIGAQLQSGGAGADKLPTGFTAGRPGVGAGARIGAPADAGGKGSLFVCDPNQGSDAAQRLLGRAGAGQEAGGVGREVGGNPRSWYSEGGSETDQANAVGRYTVARLREQQAQERMDQIKNDPGAKQRLQEAQQTHGARTTFEQQMQKKYGADYQNKMSEQEKKDHTDYKKADEDAKKKFDEDKKKYDEEKAKRDKAREDADKAKEDYDEAGGNKDDLNEVDKEVKKDETNCAPDDDRCIDEKARRQLEAGLAAINEILAKKGIAPITTNQLTNFQKRGTPIDWKINPSRDDAGGVPGNRPPVEQGLCRFADPTKSMPNPEGGEVAECSMDCPVEEMEVGHCENEEQGRQTAQKGTQVKCGNQSGVFGNQPGAIDCPQDNPNCANKPPERKCADGFPPRIICTWGASAIAGCPEDGIQCPQPGNN